MRIRFDQLPQIRALMRSHFLSGLLVVVPTGAIIWLLVIAIRALWGIQNLLPKAWQPEQWLPNSQLALLVTLALWVASLLVLAMGISFVGWISKQLLGQKILEFISDQIIQRIPVLRSVYSALDQLLRTMTAEGGHQFSRVVYVEYPRKGLWTLAFVTGHARGPAAPPDHLNIYVPTTPNPTSGFYLLVHESEVRDSHMSVEEAFRTILSLGIAQPVAGRAASSQSVRITGS